METLLRSSSPTGSIRSSPRKRAKRQTIIPSPRRGKTKPNSKVSTAVKPPKVEVEPEPPIVTGEDAARGVKQFTVFTFKYVVDVLSVTTYLVKHPLAIFLCLWMLSYLFAKVSNTVRIVLGPLCIIPGISRLPVCSINAGTPQWADYPELMKVQTRTVQLLEDSVSGSGISLEIKRGEMAASDLATLVRTSQLTSRDMLSTSLKDFVHDAKDTGRGLSRLSSKIGGAVDNIVAVNDYALRTIAGADSKPGGLAAIIPWFGGRESRVVVKAFVTSMDTMSQELKRLILEAEANLINLNNLEEKLDTIHEMIHQEETSISAARDELLSQLWTILGGNRKDLKRFNGNLGLLQNLSIYRNKARAHVVSALATLHRMQADMEDLRERVAAPQLSGPSIPLEIHMKSIQGGLERLKEGRISAKEREKAMLTQILTMAED